MTVNGALVTVIGVTEAGFAGGPELDRGADIFVPIEALPALLAGSALWLASPDVWWLNAIGRLSEGMTRAGAEAALAGVAADIAIRDTGDAGSAAFVLSPVSSGFRPGTTNEVVPVLGLALAVTLIVLVIAASNVATLVLGRGSARRHEIAVRLALGAGRRRIIRLLLTENLVLAIIGGALGLLCAAWFVDAFAARIPDAPAALDLSPDRLVLLATLVLAVATGIAFGLAPALRTIRDATGTALRNDPLRSGGNSRFRDGLVIAQVALCGLLLITSGLFLRSLARALAEDPGFAARADVLSVSFDPSHLNLPAERAPEVDGLLLQRLRGVPGVTAVSMTDNLPLSGRVLMGSVQTGTAADDDDPIGSASAAHVWPGYFDALGVTILHGRAFTEGDVRGAPSVAIVNAAFAARFIEGDAIGASVRILGGAPVEIVGVADDVDQDRLGEPPAPHVWLPALQAAPGAMLEGRTVVLRARGTARPLEVDVRAAIRALHPDLPVFDVMSMDEWIERRAGDRRLGAMLLALFGSLALVLAAVGVYGTVAHGVTRRRREIGLRVALGAPRSGILRLVLGRGARIVGIGVAIALVAGVGLSRLIAGLLFGVSPTDAVTFAAVAALLLGVALAASWLPARRAARLDPVDALRSD